MFKRLFICIIVVASACTPQQEDDNKPIIVGVLPTRVIATPVTVYPTRTLTPSPSPTASDTPIPPTITPSPTPTETPTITPIPMVELVVAVRPIPAGAAIPPEAITLYEWPSESAPYSAITNIENVINQVALVDIYCFEPIVEDLLARRTAGTGFLEFEDSCPPLATLTPPVDYTMVAVAVQYIPVGTIISPNLVILRRWPTALVPPQAITSLSEVVGNVAQQDILREQTLHTNHIKSDQ